MSHEPNLAAGEGEETSSFFLLRMWIFARLAGRFGDLTRVATIPASNMANPML
jgi:hypothetical protein